MSGLTQIAPHPQNPPAKLPVKVCADASLASCMALRDADEGSLQITTTEVAQKYITSVRGGTEPSDEEVAEYRARMKEQRKLALERREEEEAAAAAAAAKDADRRVEQEAMNLIIREIAEVTVGEAIDQAIAELKAEAIQAAVMDEQTEQVQQHNSQNSSYSPSQLPQKAAFRLETVMQGMSTVPPAGAAITVSPVPTEGNPTVVLRGTNLINRSFSANDLQPASENDKNLIEAAVATSKERLNKGLQQMAINAQITGYAFVDPSGGYPPFHSMLPKMTKQNEWDENSKTLALRTLSNVTAEASEREERKRRLQQVMLRIRTPHGSSVSLATDESEATSPGPNHFFADSDGAIKVEDHPGDLPLTPSAHRTAIQFKPNAILSVLESGRLPKNSRAAALLREKVVSPTIINAPKNFDGNIPSSVAKMTDYSQDGGPVDLTSDEDVEDERLSTPIQGLSAPTTDLVTQAQPTTALAAAGEEVDEDKVNAESITKEETAGGGVPPTGVQFGLDEEQDIPLSLSTLRPEHTAVLRHSILVRDPQSKLSQADLEVFNAIGDASPREF
ncbi:unnamed protein product [Schistocephalus solidus]|uniref:Protein kinase domain-containing protein n=1 Tax=Schistocephalus solidus TaxID=70667 RepID=A0A183SYL1_SCHSO|nr:unnamed protein product [Schistocephalus solidus]